MAAASSPPPPDLPPPHRSFLPSFDTAPPPPHFSLSHRGSQSFNHSRLPPFPPSPLPNGPAQLTSPSHFDHTAPAAPSFPYDAKLDHTAAAFSRSASFKPSSNDLPNAPFLSRNSSFQSQDPKARRALNRIVSMERRETPEIFSADEDVWKGEFVVADVGKSSEFISSYHGQTMKQQPDSIFIRARSTFKSGNQGARKLLMLILLNGTYSTVELFLGLFSGRVGLVSDAFHLTFGCGLLSFSLIAMLYARKVHDDGYSYGYKRLEVLAAFTNALFLLFLSFSLAVEALHAFVQDESEHKHYLIVSAVTNLLVNLLGVWFFRSYARIRIAYRKAADMNHHSIFLHVLADSIRSAGLILASWLLTLGVKNAETLCLGLVAIAVFLVVMPLFKATAGILLQMSPTGISASAFNKCLRQVRTLEDVVECCQARFWEMHPGFVVGTLLLQVKQGADEQKVLKHVHSLYNDIGIKDLTVQIDTQQ